MKSTRAQEGRMTLEEQIGAERFGHIIDVLQALQCDGWDGATPHVVDELRGTVVVRQGVPFQDAARYRITGQVAVGYGVYTVYYAPDTV